VKVVWVLDPQAKHVHSLEKGDGGRRFAEHQMLSGESALPGFTIGIRDLFKEPSWAR